MLFKRYDLIATTLQVSIEDQNTNIFSKTSLKNDSNVGKPTSVENMPGGFPSKQHNLTNINLRGNHPSSLGDRSRAEIQNQNTSFNKNVVKKNESFCPNCTCQCHSNNGGYSEAESVIAATNVIGSKQGIPQKNMPESTSVNSGLSKDSYRPTEYYAKNIDPSVSTFKNNDDDFEGELSSLPQRKEFAKDSENVEVKKDLMAKDADNFIKIADGQSFPEKVDHSRSGKQPRVEEEKVISNLNNSASEASRSEPREKFPNGPKDYNQGLECVVSDGLNKPENKADAVISQNLGKCHECQAVNKVSTSNVQKSKSGGPLFKERNSDVGSSFDDVFSDAHDTIDTQPNVKQTPTKNLQNAHECSPKTPNKENMNSLFLNQPVIGSTSSKIYANEANLHLPVPGNFVDKQESKLPHVTESRNILDNASIKSQSKHGDPIEGKFDPSVFDSSQQDRISDHDDFDEPSMSKQEIDSFDNRNFDTEHPMSKKHANVRFGSNSIDNFQTSSDVFKESSNDEFQLRGTSTAKPVSVRVGQMADHSDDIFVSSQINNAVPKSTLHGSPTSERRSSNGFFGSFVSTLTGGEPKKNKDDTLPRSIGTDDSALLETKPKQNRPAQLVNERVPLEATNSLKQAANQDASNKAASPKINKNAGDLNQRIPQIGANMRNPVVQPSASVFSGSEERPLLNKQQRFISTDNQLPAHKYCETCHREINAVNRGYSLKHQTGNFSSSEPSIMKATSDDNRLQGQYMNNGCITGDERVKGDSLSTPISQYESPDSFNTNTLSCMGNEKRSVQQKVKAEPDTFVNKIKNAVSGKSSTRIDHSSSYATSKQYAEKSSLNLSDYSNESVGVSWQSTKEQGQGYVHVTNSTHDYSDNAVPRVMNENFQKVEDSVKRTSNEKLQDQKLMEMGGRAIKNAL